MDENKNPHLLHRKRLKGRFYDSGFSGFSDHEILELLLCYALPRQDTNVIGHRLMERFGSLSGVFDADFRELCQVSGISEHSALLLKMVPELAKAAVAAGADGLMIEVHNNPAKAKCDGAQSLTPDQFDELMQFIGKEVEFFGKKLN